MLDFHVPIRIKSPVLLCFVGMLSLFLAPDFLQAAPVCIRKDIDTRTVEITANSHTISLIGWTHNSRDGGNELTEGVSEAYDYAQQKNCVGAIKFIGALNAKYTSLAKESRSVFERLSSAYERTSFTVAGIERSPEEVMGQVVANTINLSHLDYVAEMCPHSKSEVDKFCILISDNSIAFYDSKYPKVTVIGVESADLMEKALVSSGNVEDAQKEIAALPSRDLGLSDSASAALEKIVGDRNCTPFSDEIIQTIMSGVISQRAQIPVRKYLVSEQSNRRECIRRNTFIAAKLIKLRENQAVVLGSGHIQGLASRLMELCKQSEPL